MSCPRSQVKGGSDKSSVVPGVSLGVPGPLPGVPGLRDPDAGASFRLAWGRARRWAVGRRAFRLDVWRGESISAARVSAPAL